MIARPERWSGGIPRDAPALPDYPKPDSRNNHIYLTRIKEDVAARAIRSQLPTLLEEARKEERSPAVCYRLRPAGERAGLTVEDEISLLGLAQLAGRAARARWKRSLERLRDATEQR